MCSNSYLNHYIKVGQLPKCVISSIEMAGQPLAKWAVSSAKICKDKKKGKKKQNTKGETGAGASSRGAKDAKKGKKSKKHEKRKGKRHGSGIIADFDPLQIWQFAHHHIPHARTLSLPETA